MFELTILICTYNEAHVLEACFSSLHALLFRESISAEVILVDNGSSDDTLDLAVRLSAQLPELHLRILRRSLPGSGFGAMIRYGLAHASGRYCVLVAADGTDPIGLIPTMLTKLRTGDQMVICSRYNNAPDEAAVATRYRVYQQIYRHAIKLVLRQEITDSTNGFRAFDRTFVQALGLASRKFSVCPEMTFKTLLAGGRIAYVPGQPITQPGKGSEKFKLSNEIGGYGTVLTKAAFHRLGVPWF